MNRIGFWALVGTTALVLALGLCNATAVETPLKKQVWDGENSIVETLLIGNCCLSGDSRGLGEVQRKRQEGADCRIIAYGRNNGLGISIAERMVRKIQPAAEKKSITCSGELWGGGETGELEIGHGIYQCSVPIPSEASRKILSVCRIGAKCVVTVEIVHQPGPDADDVVITDKDRILSVRR